MEVRGLWKRYDQHVAVGGIDLRVPHGCFYGLVGPNGAGKTTTIRMMTGLLRPDAGLVWVAGHDVWADPPAAKARIGVLPDDVKLYDRLSGLELLTYTGLLRGLDPGLVADRTRDLLEVLDLVGAQDTLVVDYSTGMRKKVALAAALLHGPQVLFLDEPFESVDPVSTRTIREVLERFAGAGGTVVFSSHVMEVVERVCDRVAIVARGRIITEGEVDDVRGGRRLEDVFIELVGGREAGAGALGWLDGGTPVVDAPPDPDRPPRPFDGSAPPPPTAFPPPPGPPPPPLPPPAPAPPPGAAPPASR
ncbi:ABC transporter ATP-binding protein [Aquihabitans sp. G128]|nr:ABC transporter ATP-binding protein [Aquihabitans sp. G128]